MKTKNNIFHFLSGIFLLGFFFMTGALSPAFGMTTLEKADSAYNAGNFRLAASLYSSVLDQKGATSELYYNLGNANYRLGNHGKAIIAYERALRLNPANDDARANLEFVNSQLKGLPEDGSSFISNIHRNVMSATTPDTWGIIAFILFLLLLSSVSLYLFTNNVTVRKAGFFGGICLLVLFVYAFVLAWQSAGAHTHDDIGIVVSSNARLTTTPGTSNNKAEKTIMIPEGSKVEILDSLATPNDPVTTLWYNVALNNKSEAWIDASDVEQI